MSRLIRVGLLVLVAALALAPAASADHKSKKRSGGATTLALSEGAAAALESLGIAAAPIAPATAGSDGLRFPITRFGFNRGGLAIAHSGGISLTKGDTRVDLRKFVINLDRSPDLTAKVGDARVSILDLDLSGAKFGFDRRGKIVISGVRATLTETAAGALNGAFGTTAFQEGLELGTATVAVKFRHFYGRSWGRDRDRDRDDD